jgi:hypothetical protein
MMHGHMNVTMHGHMNVTMHGHMNVKVPLSLDFKTHSCERILLMMAFQRSKIVKVLSFNNILWNCVLVVQFLFNSVCFLFMVY